MSFLSLNIKVKNFLILGLVITGMLVLVISSQITSNKLTSLKDTETLIKELKASMLALRRNEKDFMARLDDKYVEKFSGQMDYTFKNNELLLNLLTANQLETQSATRLGAHLEDYNKTFAHLVKQQKLIGYHAEDGLYGSLRASVHNVEKMVRTHPELMADMLMLRRHEKDFMLRRTEKYITKFNAQIDSYQASVSSSTLAGAEKSQIKGFLSAYQKDFNTLADAEKVIGLDHQTGIHGELRSIIHKTETLFSEMEETLHAAAEERIVYHNNIQISLMLAITLLASAVIFLVARSIYVPLQIFSEKIHDISSNKDLSQRLNYKDRKDEISSLANSFDSLLDVLQIAVQKIQKASGEVISSANSAKSVTDDVEHATRSQSREIQQAANAMGEMNTTIQSIAENATQAADSVSTVNTRINSSAELSTEAEEAITNLVRESEKAAEAIQNLEVNSQNITQVLDSIQGIAEQTNLLALNAAIEAARAGDQGRGFAVVADEVRTLAQRTQESTETIRQTINMFQHGITDVVETVKRSNSTAASAIDKVTETSKTLDEIAQQVGVINDMNHLIATAAEEQSYAAREINKNVDHVRDFSKQVESQARETSATSKVLSRLGQDLGELVAQFKI